jgi:hypothetical protein
MLRWLALLIGSVAAVPALTACAPALTPIAGWTRGLCVDKAVAVTSPWDDAVRRVYGRLRDVARLDLATDDVAVVVVTGPPTVDGYTQAGGWVCRAGAETTIALHAWTLETAFDGADPEAALARVMAHELAHVVLHLGPEARQADPLRREWEADRLGAYYFARAGFPCQSWLDDLRRSMSQTAVRPGQIVIGSGLGRSREVIGLRQDAVERGCRQAAAGESPARGTR